MKLKEAQMLGILALIAVGIILLTIWTGGEPEPERESDPGKSQVSQSDQKEVADLEDLLKVVQAQA